MNWKPFIRIAGSSKAWVMIAAIAGVIVLACMRDGVTQAQALDFIKWIVASYLAAVGIEDAGAKANGVSIVTNATPTLAPAPIVEPSRSAIMVAPLPAVQIAVVNRSRRVTDAQAQLMTSAVATQLNEHVAPAWKREAPSMIFYGPSDAPPADAYLIAITDKPDSPDALGYHTELNNGQVCSFIFADPVLNNGGCVLYDASNPAATSIASVLSHEGAEAFIDPYCNGWADGPARAEGSVYSVEVADPVEGDQYPIMVSGQLVAVSNFVYPHWFDRDAVGKQYDHLSKVSAPFQMTPGGYMVIRNEPGTEKQVFGDKIADWKKQVKSLKLGHGGRKSTAKK